MFVLMRKLVLCFLVPFLFSNTLFAQTQTVTLTDANQNAVQGAAVFFVKNQRNLGLQNLSSLNVEVVYTNAQGVAASPLALSSGDTVKAFTKDCNDQLQIATFGYSSASQNQNFSSFCPPTACQAHLVYQVQGNNLRVKAYALRDSAAAAIPGGSVNHTYRFNGQKFSNPSNGSPNMDSISRPISSFSSLMVGVCYSRSDSLCPNICDSVRVANPINCNVNLVIDSLNSNYSQRNILLRPSFSTNASLLNYTVTFGDGNSVTTSADSVSYIYAGNGTYQVCITATFIRTNFGDTCTASYCRTITFPYNLNCQAGYYVDYFNSDFSQRSVAFVSTSTVSGQGPRQFYWNFGNGTQDTTTNQGIVAQYSTDGTYNVCHAITYSNFGVTCTDTICKTIDVNPNAGPLFCKSLFSKDTSSGAGTNGQLIISECSSTRRGNIVSWNWDFGDGNTSGNRLPTHTYPPVAARYTVCLTIMSVSGADTCSSTYCDSVAFDANGNWVNKNAQGKPFTINIVDPGSVSLAEVNPAHFDLFPNPAKEKTTLQWPESIRVQSVSVYTLNGVLVQREFDPHEKLVLGGLSPGAYLIRLETQNKPTTLKLLVE